MKRRGNLLNFILDQLSDLEGITFRKTFKGIQFLREEIVFARIQGGKFKLQAQTACTSHPDLEVEIQENGQPVFLCEVPEPVLEDKQQLQKWIGKILKK